MQPRTGTSTRPTVGLDSVLARRRAEREDLLRTARSYADALSARLHIRAAVVFGSVARGDFNQWSDIDLLVIAEDLPADALTRLDALGPRPARVQPIAWTLDEWRTQLDRKNPITVEAVAKGVWVSGSTEKLSQA